MLNRFLFTLALVAASPAMLFSQDIFLAFDQGPDLEANEVVQDSAIGTSSSAFIFARNGFNLGALEIDFSVDNTSVLELTGATIFNSDVGPGGAFGTRWDQIIDPTGAVPPIDETVAELDAGSNSSGRVFATAIRGTSTGLNTAFSTFDADFNAAADAFLVGQVDFNIVGVGTTNFALAPANDTAFADLAFNIVSPTIAGGTFEVEGVPEPGSVTLLALGFAGLVARRRRRA